MKKQKFTKVKVIFGVRKDGDINVPEYIDVHIPNLFTQFSKGDHYRVLYGLDIHARRVLDYLIANYGNNSRINADGQMFQILKTELTGAGVKFFNMSSYRSAFKQLYLNHVLLKVSRGAYHLNPGFYTEHEEKKREKIFKELYAQAGAYNDLPPVPALLNKNMYRDASRILDKGRQNVSENTNFLNEKNDAGGV